MYGFELIENFPQEFSLLQSLFPDSHFTHQRKQRLNQIFGVTEEKWERNLDRLNGVAVKYLLIGEAAPWSEPGSPARYFYNTCDGRWVDRIWRTFWWTPYLLRKSIPVALEPERHTMNS